MFSPWVIVPAGSPATRPVKCTPGFTVVLETLYPRPMLPALSIAAAPIQRKFASGAQVPCCASASVALEAVSSYQRTPVLVPAVMEWFVTRCPTPFKFR